MSPERDTPQVPDGYGAESVEGHVDWSDVEARLRESQNYWLCTSRADGRPHVIPRWGVWVEAAFWYDGSSETVHARNLGEDGPCALHLESGTEVVILEGRSIVSAPPTGDLGKCLAEEFGRKYAPTYQPTADAWSRDDAGGMRVLRPAKALAWMNFPKDLTRFKF